MATIPKTGRVHRCDPAYRMRGFSPAFARGLPSELTVGRGVACLYGFEFHDLAERMAKRVLQADHPRWREVLRAKHPVRVQANFDAVLPRRRSFGDVDAHRIDRQTNYLVKFRRGRSGRCS